MALRQIRVYGDDILTKKCREVKEMTPRLQELIDDMLETMYDADGVGLAAPQVGVLGKIGQVTRPGHVIVEGLDRDMNPVTVEGEELLARALCHELDHLEGVVYTTKVEGELYDAGALDEEEEDGESGESEDSAEQ